MTKNPMICVCVAPLYGGRLVGCRRCGRPPFPEARAELGLSTQEEGPWAAHGETTD